MSRLGPFIIASDDTVTPAVATSTSILSTGQGGFGQDVSAATGVPVFTAGTAAFQAALAASVGGTGVDTSALTGTPHLVAGTWSFPVHCLNVKSYGATGDGTTDDTAAIQAALDAAELLGTTVAFAGTGATVFFPPGTYRISELTVKGSVVLQGSGKGSQLYAIDADDAAEAMILIEDEVLTRRCRISDFLIDGNKDNQTASVRGIYLKAATSSDKVHTLGNLIVQNTKGNGIEVENGANFLTNIYLVAADLNGIVIDGHDNVITGCHVGLTGKAGIQLVGGGNQVSNTKVFEAGQADSANGDGFQIFAGYNKLFGVDCSNNLANGIYIGPTANNYGGIIEGALFDGVTGADACIALSSASHWRIRGHATGQGGPWANLVTLSGTCIENDIEITYTHTAALPAITGTAPVGGTIGSNRIVLGPRGNYVATAGASYTPDPYRYEVVSLALTEALTVSNVAFAHLGQYLRFAFFQSGVGGFAVTWGDTYVVNWTPDTTAGKSNCIDFRFDGTNWVQVSTATGL